MSQKDYIQMSTFVKRIEEPMLVSERLKKNVGRVGRAICVVSAIFTVKFLCTLADDNFDKLLLVVLGFCFEFSKVVCFQVGLNMLKEGFEDEGHKYIGLSLILVGISIAGSIAYLNVTNHRQVQAAVVSSDDYKSALSEVQTIEKSLRSAQQLADSQRKINRITLAAQTQTDIDSLQDQLKTAHEHLKLAGNGQSTDSASLLFKTLSDISTLSTNAVKIISVILISSITEALGCYLLLLSGFRADIGTFTRYIHKAPDNHSHPVINNPPPAPTPTPAPSGGGGPNGGLPLPSHDVHDSLAALIVRLAALLDAPMRTQTTTPTTAAYSNRYTKCIDTDTPKSTVTIKKNTDTHLNRYTSVSKQIHRRNTPKRRTAGMADTCTQPGKDTRFAMLKAAVEEGRLDKPYRGKTIIPIRSVINFCKCSQQVADRYLDALTKEGLVIKNNDGTYSRMGDANSNVFNMGDFKRAG